MLTCLDNLTVFVGFNWFSITHRLMTESVKLRIYWSFFAQNSHWLKTMMIRYRVTWVPYGEKR